MPLSTFLTRIVVTLLRLDMAAGILIAAGLFAFLVWH
jgi:hypothetical protein